MTEFHEKQWNKLYEKIVEFKRNNGHCLVPQGYEKDVSLGMWVNTQRQFHSKNTIRLDRKVLLDDIGFVWKVGNYALESIWKKKYEQLVEFKQKNGHCIVGKIGCMDEDNKALGKWISNQRERHRNNKMRLDRKDLLDEIGFGWSVAKSAPDAVERPKNSGSGWNKQYEKLVEFKRKNGHCSVPRTYQKDVSLGKWVSNQRQIHVSNTLRLDRKVLLDELGFVWRKRRAAGNYKMVTDETWHKQYEKLVKFKQTNGHCLVPKRYQEDVSLGAWVSDQRSNHTNTSILQDRKELLDDLGFTWKVRTSGADNTKHDKYYHQQYGKLPELKQTNNNALAARSTITDVRCRHCISHFALYSGRFSHSLSFFAFNLWFRIRIRRRSSAVWLFQMQQ
jgi:hypothetical protein